MADKKPTIEKEIWKAIPRFPGYEVSNQGKIRSYWGVGVKKCKLNKPPHFLKQSLSLASRTQYYFVDLGYGNHRAVHRLVLMAFRGPCPKGLVACHNDGNPLNNHIDNLRWDTRQSNFRDAVKHGNPDFVGERNIHAKLTENNVIDIRKGAYNHLTRFQIAKLFGVCPRSIFAVIHRETWKHIP